MSIGQVMQVIGWGMVGGLIALVGIMLLLEAIARLRYARRVERRLRRYATRSDESERPMRYNPWQDSDVY